MYIAYPGLDTEVDLIADGGSAATAKTVGTAKFLMVDGNLTLIINLTGGTIFYYDKNDPLYDNNLKVQDYDMAPRKTPSPGSFAWKTRITPGSTEGSIIVPLNSYYGIHLDVAVPVDCEE
jgi:hypothetical protein